MERWKVYTGMALLILFGFVCGAVTANLWRDRHEPGRSPRGPLGAFLAPELARKLDLDPEQLKAFDAVIEEVRAQFLAIRQEFRPRADTILDAAFQRLDGVLRPEQRERLRAIRQEHPWPQPSPSAVP